KLAKSEAEKNVKLAQERMKKYSDGKRREEHFALQDLVLVTASCFRLKSVLGSLKLNEKWVGPFVVIGVRDNDLYELDLSKALLDKNVHSVFDVSKLKKF